MAEEVDDATLAIIYTGLTVFGMVVGAGLLRYVTPTRGVGARGVASHVVFGAVSFCLVCLAPEAYTDVLFCESGYAVAGVAFPLLESVRAIVSEGTEDDTRWLAYWIAAGALMLSTEWLDSLREAFPEFADFYYQSAVLVLVWLQLPFTDGATLLYDRLTAKFVVPRLEPFAAKIDGGSFVAKLTRYTITGVHLYALYVLFIILPGAVERFAVVVVGTAYPLAASVLAVSTNSGDDDTRWLLYWSSFAVLYLVMSMTEDVLDIVPGFYSLALTAVVYLMLPCFGGAETVFRDLLVPAFGLQATLVKQDAKRFAKAITNLDPTQQEALLDEFKIFAEETRRKKTE